MSKKAVGDRPYCDEGNGICDEQGRGTMGRAEESVVESLNQGRRLRQWVVAGKAAGIAGSWFL